MVHFQDSSVPHWIDFSRCVLMVLESAFAPLHNGVQVDFLEIYDGTRQVGPPTFFDGVHNMSTLDSGL
jgi:hypothetical protein